MAAATERPPSCHGACCTRDRPCASRGFRSCARITRASVNATVTRVTESRSRFADSASVPSWPTPVMSCGTERCAGTCLDRRSPSIGLNVFVTVLFKQVFDITGDELDIGLLGLAQFLPAILLVLVSGWVADRFDRRRVSSALPARPGRVCAGLLVLYTLAEPDLGAGSCSVSRSCSVRPMRCCPRRDARSRR